MRLSKSDRKSLTILCTSLLAAYLINLVFLVSVVYAERASGNQCILEDSFTIDLDGLGEGELQNLDLDHLTSLIENDIESSETDNCKERAAASASYFKDNFGITFSSFCTKGCPEGSTCVPRGIALSSNSPGSSDLKFRVSKYGWWTKKKRFSHSDGKEGEEVWFYVKNGCHCCED